MADVRQVTQLDQLIGDTFCLPQQILVGVVQGWTGKNRPLTLQNLAEARRFWCIDGGQNGLEFLWRKGAVSALDTGQNGRRPSDLARQFHAKGLPIGLQVYLFEKYLIS